MTAWVAPAFTVTVQVVALKLPPVTLTCTRRKTSSSLLLAAAVRIRARHPGSPSLQGAGRRPPPGVGRRRVGRIGAGARMDPARERAGGAEHSSCNGSVPVRLTVMTRPAAGLVTASDTPSPARSPPTATGSSTSTCCSSGSPDRRRTPTRSARAPRPGCARRGSRCRAVRPTCRGSWPAVDDANTGERLEPHPAGVGGRGVTAASCHVRAAAGPATALLPGVSKHRPRHEVRPGRLSGAELVLAEIVRFISALARRASLVPGCAWQGIRLDQRRTEL